MTTLHTIGTALYGQQWRSALARDLGVHERTVRRWAAARVPDDVALRLETLVLERISALHQARSALICATNKGAR